MRQDPKPPSGLPEGEDNEITPLGVPAGEDADAHDPDDLPGFPQDGEGDTAG
jgi:hypothetical protein